MPTVVKVDPSCPNLPGAVLQTVDLRLVLSDCAALIKLKSLNDAAAPPFERPEDLLGLLANASPSRGKAYHVRARHVSSAMPGRVHRRPDSRIDADCAGGSGPIQRAHMGGRMSGTSVIE
ncbi:hypothetical protein BJF93_02810 [Xaviernesmea oryzae]|uniref:Uncharacterized protein n=1 Tax=Xaviernesmea oryzae TaxID=464029 RepID=A0A1Q9AZ92_9HYPH|nr:hypothetical protein BJF93_02810 [Xaviernesmea oryzae]